MNSLTKNLALAKQKAEAIKAKAGEATEAMKAKAGEARANLTSAATNNNNNNNNSDINNNSASIPTEVDTTSSAAMANVSSLNLGESSSICDSTSEQLDAGTTPMKKISVRASITEFASKFKQSEVGEPVEVSDLMEVLSTLFEVDPTAKKPHEMVEALAIQGIQTWRGFLLMAEEDIQQLTNTTKEGSVAISKNGIRMLTYLKQFTLHNINSGVENAKDPNLYTREAFDAYVEDLQLGRKSALSQDDSTTTTTAKLPSKLTNVRASISGFASKLKPGTSNNNNSEDNSSIADILHKAKAKVFRGNNTTAAAGAAPGDDASVGASSAGAESTEGGVVADDNVAFEDMKKNVDDLASKLETTAQNVSNKGKEEVQKLMVPLLAKLNSSQDKFSHMIEVRKKKRMDKKEENAAAATAAATAAAETTEEAAAAGGDDDTSTSSSHNTNANTTNNKKEKLKNLLSSAEHATKRAFENAEKVARQAARKAGILDDDKDATEAIVAAPAAPLPKNANAFDVEESM